MAMHAKQQSLVNDLVSRLQIACGTNLDSVALYGSAAAADFAPQFSDINILCLLKHIDAHSLQPLSPVVQWWHKQSQPLPMVSTLEELQRSADVFAIEMLEIKGRHKMLFGADRFDSIEVPMALHRVEVERELRTNLIRLRQRFLTEAHSTSNLLGLMAESSSTFVTLFRHALIAFGDKPPEGREAVVERMLMNAGADHSAFKALLAHREGKAKIAEGDVHNVFAKYLDSIVRVTEEVDRRLA